MMRYFITLLIFLSSFYSFPATIFSENMGTPGGTTTVAAHTFQNTGLTFTGTADVRNTAASAGYTGASGNGNVFFTNVTGREFVIGGINTVGYTSLTLSFGHFKNLAASTNELAVEVSTDGTTYTPLSYVRSGGGSTWALVTATGTIPATANLRIRFRQTINTANGFFRIDDVKLEGTPGCTIATAPTTSSSAFSATPFCTSAQVGFTAGNGARRIVVVSLSNFAGTPANGTAYTANTTFGSGSTVGAGNFVVLNGTGNSVTITGLTPATNYFVKVFEYNGATANCDESYLATGVTSFQFTTQSACSTPQVRSVLVDACSSQEGIDELVIIENGNNPLNISDMTLAFPSGGTYCNSGCGVNTFLNNPTYINQLNTLAGCTLFQYADPIPAGSIIVVFCGLTPSYTFDYSSQCPAGSTYYAVFCNNSSTAGRFANSGSGTRTLDATFGANAEQVTYDLGSTLGDGTFVDFDIPGNPTYRQELNCIYSLGVEWSYFTGEPSSEGIALSWETLSETDSDHFSVERADASAAFEQIGTLPAAGNSITPLRYAFTDRYPAEGLNYYRLKQWDRNGAFSYSDILAFDFRSEGQGVHYLAAEQQLVFSQSLEEGTQVVLFQSNGQTAVSELIASETTSVPVKLAAGMYVVRTIEPNGKVRTSRFAVY